MFSKRHWRLSGLLVAGCIGGAGSVATAGPIVIDPAGKIEPALHDVMGGKAADEAVVVGVWLRQDHDPNDDYVAYLAAATPAARDGITARTRQKIAAAQQPFINWSTARGHAVVYRSQYAPVVFMSLPNNDITPAAARPDVDRIYVSRTYEVEMEHAEKSVRADVAWARGINGSGLAATWVGVVEFARINFANPYLNHLGNTPTFRPGGALGQHVTSVAGIIAAATDGSAGNHGRYRGVAYGAAGLINANSDSGADFDIIEAVEWAMDQNGRILNNSWGSDTGLAIAVLDRYYDYLARNQFMTLIKSAGNNAGGFGSANGNLTSPGLGYNVITVGSFGSLNNNRWNDDRMTPSSSFRPDPGNPAGQDRQKPDLVAAGEDQNGRIDRLSDTGAAVQPLGRGTSFAAPAVTGACLLLAERQLELLTYPAAMRAILMASACHNIEGDARLSNLDGAGALVVCEADEVAEQQQYHHDLLIAADFQPNGYWAHTINLDAGDGNGPPKWARVVLTWFSNPSRQEVAGASTALTNTTLADATNPFGLPNSKVGWFLQPNTANPFTYQVIANTAGTLTVGVGDTMVADGATLGDNYVLFQNPTDPLDANLDLRIWDVTAGAYVAGADSNSVGNNFEISRFTPANTGPYEVRVFPTAFNGTLEPVALAWAQEPCCMPDWGDAPDDMLPCTPRPKRGDFPTRMTSVGASAKEFEVEWLSADNQTTPGATWEMDAWVMGREAEKDEDGQSNINLPPVCLPDQDAEDDGVVPDPIYIAGTKGQVSFWVNSATPNIGRYSAANPDEKIYVRGWFDWEHDDVSWAGNQMVMWVGGPTMVGQMMVGQTCLEGCDLWDPAQNQKLVTIDFEVPEFLPEGPFWIRFRQSYGEDDTVDYNTPAGATFTGEATFRGEATYGEIEDHTSYQAPAIEIDAFPFSEAVVTLITPFGTETVMLNGPTTVHVGLSGLNDGDANLREQVPTEMVQLNLTGNSALVGPVEVRLRPQTSTPFLPTLGEIEEKQNTTPGVLDLAPFTAAGAAASYFDVYFEIEAAGMVLHNNQPKTMEAQITHKPPAAGEIYFSAPIIPLFDEADQPTGIAIGAVWHLPNPSPCPTDLNHDGTVNAADLAQLLGAWGPNPGHPADFNFDGVINAADLAQLLGSWGPCEPSPQCQGDADCADQSVCNGIETCIDGICDLGIPLSCEDGDPCTDDACDERTGCLHTPNEAPCDDGDACTVGESCAAGECAGGALRNCDDGIACTVDFCAPDVGCMSSPDPAACDDRNPCTADLCADEGENCVHEPISGSCDDGNLCTVGGSCVAGECVSEPLFCDDNNPCTLDACDPAVGCVSTPLFPCCGNGILEPGETCDPPDGVTCGTDCQLVAVCPGDGDCCADGGNGSPGCNNLECCTLVCDNDPFCCTVDWGPVCASVAQSACVICGGGISDCCVPHLSPGCDNPACATNVCLINPLCCKVQWSNSCAALALTQCPGVCPGTE